MSHVWLEWNFFAGRGGGGRGGPLQRFAARNVTWFHTVEAPRSKPKGACAAEASGETDG